MLPPPVVQAPLPYHEDRTQPVNGIVVHCMGEYVRLTLTEGGRFAAWDFLERSAGLAGGKLSAHCLVSPGGTVLRCVADDQVAYHAGLSRWQGRDSLNGWCLGIEMLVAGDWEYSVFRRALLAGSAEYTGACLESTAWQVATWVKQYGVSLDNVVRHSDVAGDDVRGAGKGKRDPGAGLNWLGFKDLVSAWLQQFKLEERDHG